MIDLSDAVQTAAYANLANAVTLATVYAVPPENAEMPFVVIADDDIDPTIGGKDDGFEQHTIHIVSVIAGASKRPLFAIMKQVSDALAGMALHSPGALLSEPVLMSSHNHVDVQNGVVIGEQHFLIFAQPED